MKHYKILLAGSILALSLLTGCRKDVAQENTSAPIMTERVKTTETSSALTENTETPQPSDMEIIGTEEPFVITDEDVIAGMSKDILNNMTLEEKIGQMFIVNFENLDSSKGSYYEFRKITNKMKKNMQKYHIGGVIFFSRNIENIEQTKLFIQNLQENSRIPLFISVDEEGGDVARIANNPNMNTTKFPSMEQVGANEEPKYAYEMGKTIGSEIKELGFNLDFAPVADVRTNEKNTEIGNRSFGSDEKKVSKMVSNEVKGLQEQGVSATLKHFPGQGSTSGDTHQEAVNLESDLMKLRVLDFLPFQAGVKAGADFIMVSHISVSRVSGTTEPASLCSTVMKRMVREELGFNGIVITDAMDMKAITNKYSAKEAAVKAVTAGADMILMPDNLEQAYNGIMEAVKSGDITEKQIDDSVKKIIQTKIRRGVITGDTKLIYNNRK